MTVSCFLERDIMDLLCCAVFLGAISLEVFWEKGIMRCEIYMDSLHGWLRKRNELYCRENVPHCGFLFGAKNFTSNTSFNWWLWKHIYILWISNWCSTTRLPFLIWFVQIIRNMFSRLPASCLRKMVQSPINYSVHVVLSGPRHPHPLVSLLAPNTAFV